MNSRERVRKVMNHEEPDRLPLDLGGVFTNATSEMQTKIAETLGLTGEPDKRFKNFDDRIQKHFETDIRMIQPVKHPNWGIDFEKPSLADAEEVEDILNYSWPKFEADMIAGLAEEAKFLHEETDYAIAAFQITQGIFECACYLRGYDQILMDMMAEKDMAHAIFEKILETNLKLADPYYKAIGQYVDLVYFGDDLAMQDRTYMSPDLFDEMIRPYHEKYIKALKKDCPNAYVVQHCCGSVYDFVEKLSECGVDALNPVQTTASKMEPENLKNKKSIMSFHGGVDLQHILPYGTTEEVQDFVENLIVNLAPGGGYIFGPSHSLPDDVKPENVITAFETAKKLANYPIKTN